METGKHFPGGKIPPRAMGKTLQQALQEKIITDEKILRQPSRPLSRLEAGILKLDTVLPEMVKRGWTDGAAISAIQLGVPVQFSYIHFSLKFLKPGVKPDGPPKPEEIDVKEFGPYWLLNPYIVPGSAKNLIRVQREGCLSLPNRHFDTWRFNEVTVYNAWDQKEITATGFMAWCLQHELDHMAGILCCDRTDIERNAPCPCGQPLKAKKCCLKDHPTTTPEADHVGP